MGHRRKDISQAETEQCQTMSNDQQNSDRHHIQISRYEIKIRKKKKCQDVLSQVITKHFTAETNISLPVSISSPLSFLSRETLLHTLHICSLAYFNLGGEQVPHLRDVMEK